MLISPVAVGDVSDTSKTICIELTREQIANAPRFSPHMPISRAYEQAYYQHYNWPPYWEHDPVAAIQSVKSKDKAHKNAGSLRSSQSYIGFDIAADQSVIGKLEHMIVDMQYWRVRYMGVNASELPVDKTVLINLAWIDRIDLQQRMVRINMSRGAIEHAPPFDPDKPINRDYEASLFSYHGRQPYWS